MRYKKVKFWSKTLSDEEYVEQIRKRGRIFRRIQWIWPVLLIALVSCLFGYVGMIQRFVADIPAERAMIYAGFALGAIFGFMFIMTAAQAGMALNLWIKARKGFRTERLLLQYHDRLMEKEVSNKSVQTKSDDNRETTNNPNPATPASNPGNPARPCSARGQSGASFGR